MLFYQRVMALGALFAGALLPFAALAHGVPQGTGGFGAGFTHPLTGPDHFIAMFAVGLWGAQLGGRQVWSLPVTFPLIMVLGGVLGIAGAPIPPVETGIALSVLALGAVIAFAWRPPELIDLLLVSVFAIFHGYAHGLELPKSVDPAKFAIGFVSSTGMIHIAGIGVGLLLARPMGGRLMQALGGLIALSGFYFLLA